MSSFAGGLYLPRVSLSVALQLAIRRAGFHIFHTMQFPPRSLPFGLSRHTLFLPQSAATAFCIIPCSWPDRCGSSHGSRVRSSHTSQGSEGLDRKTGVYKKEHPTRPFRAKTRPAYRRAIPLL